MWKRASATRRPGARLFTNAGYIRYCRDKLAHTVTSRFATKPPDYGTQDRRGAPLFVTRKTTEEHSPLTP